MQSRTNIIMSHGGRHGAGGTYLRGTKMDRKVSENVPNRLLTGNSREAWAGEGPPTAPGGVRRKVSNADDAAFAKGSPEAARLLEAIKEDEAVKKKADAKKAAPKAEPKVEPPTVPRTPTSRRQLTVMRKGELIALADSVEVESSGTADEIRARLRPHFFGEDDPKE